MTVYQEPAFDKCRGIEKIAICQELGLDKNGKSSVIKSQLLINGHVLAFWVSIMSQLLRTFVF